MKEELKKILKISDLNYSNEFHNFNFEIEAKQNSINCILCFDSSASALLKIIGNVEDNFQGEIKLKNDNSKVIYIPKEPSSLPWFNVEENIKFVINNSELSVNISNEQIQKVIESVGLAGYEKHFSDNSSLGFRFRISLARALVLQPALILIDNSFYKMDDETKFELYDLLKNVSSDYNVSILLSSTDINETIYLSEIIYLMKGKK
ncbi:MAG: ATP-binding cassette domain-containing protein, partial [Bacteroidetes bacterium]|nr:ATP-binding cassette domain-containing protein [Bacteroidota bacterium]